MSQAEETKTVKLTGKIFITGKIHLRTGMHIGGNKDTLDIGGVDLTVIKTPRSEVPFIPGSSLKGKLRSLLARTEGSVAVSKKDLPEGLKDWKTDEDIPDLLQIFGASGDNTKEPKPDDTPTRLLVRDAFLNTEDFEKDFPDPQMDFDYSYVKTENTINRLTGTAENPRQLERVPAGAKFDFELVYDCYDDDKVEKHLQKIALAMELLEDDYIGGSGSRGYGQICFEAVEAKIRKISNYGKLESYPAFTFKPKESADA